MAKKKDIKCIIISRPDAIGDVVLTLPMCGLIKKYYPEMKIIFLGRSYTAPIINCCEHVDLFLNADILLNLNAKDACNQLKKLNADAIIHVFPNKKMAALAKKVGIKLRVGTRNRLFHWITMNKLISLSRKKSNLHESQLNCKLLEGIGIKDIPSLDQMPNYTGFTKINVQDEKNMMLLGKNKKNIILHPKSNGSGREWSLDNYKALINLLPSEKYQIFISGTENEKKILADWIKTLPCEVKDLTGELSLTEFISFINEVDFLVASGTGPLHIAAACGIGAIGIFPPIKPIHPGRWKPIGKQARAICKEVSCNDCQYNPKACHCINEVSAEQVASIILT